MKTMSYFLRGEKDFKITAPKSLCDCIHVIHSSPFSTLESPQSLESQLIPSNVATQRGSCVLVKRFLSAFIKS